MFLSQLRGAADRPSMAIRLVESRKEKEKPSTPSSRSMVLLSLKEEKQKKDHLSSSSRIIPSEIHFPPNTLWSIDLLDTSFGDSIQPSFFFYHR